MWDGSARSCLAQRSMPLRKAQQDAKRMRTEVVSAAVPAGGLAGLDVYGCRLCASTPADKPAGGDANTTLTSASICR